MRDHITEKHDNHIAKQCEQCGKYFNFKKSLWDLINEKHDNHITKQCKQCETTYSTIKVGFVKWGTYKHHFYSFIQDHSYETSETPLIQCFHKKNHNFLFLKLILLYTWKLDLSPWRFNANALCRLSLISELINYIMKNTKCSFFQIKITPQ